MRVGFIMRAHPPDDDACLVGGAAKSPYRMLGSLREHVGVAGVVVADHRGGYSTDGYRVRGLPLRRLKLYARTFAWNMLTFPWVLQLFARSDVVQCHHPNLGLGAAVARRLFFRRTPFVVKAHGTALPELRANRYTGARGAVLAVNGAMHRRHDRWVLRSADRCLVSSDHQRAEMVDTYGVEPARLRRIYNGVDPRYVRTRSRAGADAAAAPRLVFVGRVVPKKGYRTLRDLYLGVRAELPATTLTLVLGHRARVEDRPTFRFVVDELVSLPGCRVLFDLPEPELYDVLATSDVGIVPSEGYESIPTVVLEMGAVGLPVFATYQWGIPEVLPQEFALTGETDADVARLAAFVRTELAAWDSAAWARRYADFRYDRLAPQYCAVYEELAGRARA